MNTTSIPTIIRRERKRKKLTMRQLAERTGVSWITIQRIEAGGNVHLDSLVMILTGLGYCIELVERK